MTRFVLQREVHAKAKLAAVSCFVLLAAAAVSNVEADNRLVVNGQTSVLLDTDALSMLGLMLVVFLRM